MSHTSGPWEIHWCWDVAGYPCFYIHGLAGDQKRDENVMAANARLIAAAPQLLEALKALRSFMWSEGYADQTSAMKLADEAIAKVGI